MAKKQPNFKKMAESVPWLSILAGIFVILLLARMTTRNNSNDEGMQRMRHHSGESEDGPSARHQQHSVHHGGSRQQEACAVQQAVQNASHVVPNSSGESQSFAKVPGGGGQPRGLPESCNVPKGNEPSALLPKESSSKYSPLKPGKLKNVPLLKAGWLRGIDTVGASLRNANLQVRSEPPNPQVKVSPWMNSTIQPDLMRVPLEVGCGPPCNSNN